MFILYVRKLFDCRIKTPQVASHSDWGSSSSSYDYEDEEPDPVAVVLIIISVVVSQIAFFIFLCWRCYRYNNQHNQAITGQVIAQPDIISTAQSRPSASRQGDSFNYQRPPKSPNRIGYPPAPTPGPHTGYPSNYTGYPPYNQYPAMQNPAASTGTTLMTTENLGVGFQNPPPYSVSAENVTQPFTPEQPQGYVASPYIYQPPGYVDPSSAQQSTGAISSPFPTGATPSASPNPFNSDRSQAD